MTNTVAVVILTRVEATVLTDRIRESAEQTWSLLVEAHEGRAWSALGYGTWAEYVGAEFGMSRSRSYQLIDQAVVIRELGAVSTDVDITEADARRIKPVLPEVRDELRDRTNPEMSRAEVADVLRKVISEVKEREANDLADKRERHRQFYEENPHLLPKFVPTVPCPNCGGSGRLPKESA